MSMEQQRNLYSSRPAGAAPAPPRDTPVATPSIAEDAQQKVGQAVEQVRERGKSQLATEKDRVAGTVGSVASALRATGRQLEQGDDAAVAEYVDRVADSVEQLSQRLRERNVDELIGDTERFARRQPALFLGGAFFIGLAAARFLKSSRPEPSVGQTSGNGAGTFPRSPAGTPYDWQKGQSTPRPTEPPMSSRPLESPANRAIGSPPGSPWPRSS